MRRAACRVIDIELLGQVAAYLLASASRIKVALSRLRNHASSPQQEQESPEHSRCELFRIESFVGVLVCSLVIEPCLTYGCDNDPVAWQVDGITIALVNGGHTTTSIRSVERVTWALSFYRDDVSLMPVELSQYGVDVLPIDLHVSRESV